MNAPYLTAAQRRELSALIVQYAQPQFEKDANILASLQKLPAMLQGVSRFFRGAPKPRTFMGAKLPPLPTGQTYRELARAGKIKPQVRLTATDPNGLDLVLTPTARGGTPMQAGAAIREAMQAKLKARELMLSGKKPTPALIQKIRMLGDVGENPATYSDLPAAIKQTVADRVRGVVSPRMQFKRRVSTGAPQVQPQATPPAAAPRATPPAKPVEPPPLPKVAPQPAPVAPAPPSAPPAPTRPVAPPALPATPRLRPRAARPARPTRAPAATDGLPKIELIDPDIGGTAESFPRMVGTTQVTARPPQTPAGSAMSINVSNLPWLNSAVK